jgi:hypothetical protein
MERRCASTLAEVVAIEPLARALAEALRAGRHPPDVVKRLAATLEAEFQCITPEGCDEFFVDHIGRVVEIFVDAAARGDAVECHDDEH